MFMRARPFVRRARPVTRGSGRLRLPFATRAARGQAMVEFAFVLLPVLLLIVGIVQFGLLFGANVTLTNAAREAARAGTIYTYDFNHTKAWNDAQRCGDVAQAAMQSFGFLSTSSPYFSVTLTGGACPTPTGDGQTNGDLTISYCEYVDTPASACPDASDTDTACDPDTRQGCLLRVTLTYRSDIVVPFIGALLSTDSNGRFVQQATATMVVN
jgi:Flp pilus assembly protein TadG